MALIIVSLLLDLLGELDPSGTSKLLGLLFISVLGLLFVIFLLLISNGYFSGN